MQRTRAPFIILGTTVTVMAGITYWLMKPAENETEMIAAQEVPGRFRVQQAGGPVPVRRGPRYAEADSNRGRVRQASASSPGVLEAPQMRIRKEEIIMDALPDSEAYPVPAEMRNLNLLSQTKEEAHAKSWGCMECHKTVHDPHFSMALNIGCTDCHGGDANQTVKEKAHVPARFPDVWRSAATPIRTYTVLNHESPEFIRFMNPSDLRVAHISCGTSGCHPKETLEVKKSMMSHGCMLWGAAAYNNGTVNFKWPLFGEAYSMNGAPLILRTIPAPTPEDKVKKGILPFLAPLPRFQNSQPGNVFRIFERGGRFVIETGIPERINDPGKPREKLGKRGLGTGNRTDPGLVSLNKTRLFDTLWTIGTADHPGEYRNSGCASCHVVYANDRSPVHSGPYAKYGNRGLRAPGQDEMVATIDPTIPNNESGHPIEHRFTRAIPTSQCMVCHIHPGTTVMNSYIGYMWWDLETDGEHMYPAKQRYPTAEEFIRSQMGDPNDATARGLWSDPEFLARSAELNPYLKHTQFADFHSHGWMFQAVFKQDREGVMLDHKNNKIENPTNQQLQMSLLIPQYVKQLYKDRDKKSPKFLARMEKELDKLRDNVPVHMMDIHMEKGMHCVDCHFIQDVHGNTKLYGEVRAAIEVQCVDCHGDAYKTALDMGNGSVRTSGPAAKERPSGPLGRNLSGMRTPFGKRRFERRGDKLIQHSMVEKGVSWEVKQVRHTIDPAHKDYNPLSAISKTVRFDESGGKMEWGDLPADPNECAHAIGNMSCIACHSSWNPSCYGCHLPQKADKKMPELHYEGDVTLNYSAYNWQTLRNEVFMLARDGVVTGQRVNPVRSACAIHVGSYNKNREGIYVQQQTVSSDGLSGIAFSTNVPHTVRGKNETKMCTDCHVSKDNDNNALMAQLLMHGTNYMNFIGKWAWVAADSHGLFAVKVTEREEPQTVIGSTMHRLAFPDYYAKHVQHEHELKTFHEHPGNDIIETITKPWAKVRIHNIQHRGEWVLAAAGPMGLRIFDMGFIDHKGFSERIVSAPVSPIGQRLYVRTKYAMDVAVPSTNTLDGTRKRHPENMEPEIHPLYKYAYVADKYEGLITVEVSTLLDGNPTDNFIERACTFNPGGVLAGAKQIEIVGTYAYICCDAGLVVVDISNPCHPQISEVVHDCHHPNASAVQFRYGFVATHDGLVVLDTTDIGHPKVVSKLNCGDAHNLYVVRNYAYLAGGHQGLIIVNVTNPEQPHVDQVFNPGGCINDLHDVRIGITYTSLFAYLADGKNGMRVVQLTSPETPGNRGFGQRPTPHLIATFPIPKGGHAVAISEGMDRDRAVDESGNQTSVFGRVGAGPLSLEDQRRMYISPAGNVYKVMDGKRDYTVTDEKQRKLKLFNHLRSFYPAYNNFDPKAKAPAKLPNGLPGVPAPRNPTPVPLPSKPTAAVPGFGVPRE